MGEVFGIIVFIVLIGGVIWLGFLANRSIRRQSGNRMMKRSTKERNAIRESSTTRGNLGGGGMS